MAVITAANARELAARGVARRRELAAERIARAQAPDQPRSEPDEYLLRQLARVRKQIDLLSAMIEGGELEPRDLQAVATAKTRLRDEEAALANRPGPGQRRPGPERRQPPATDMAPLDPPPASPTPPPAPPAV